MEEFIAYSFIGLSAVLCVLGLSSGRRIGVLKERGLRLARDIIPLALVSLDAWDGVPAFLLTADIMFCDAVLLQSATVPQSRGRFPFMAVLLSLVFLVRIALEVSGHRFPVYAAAFMTLSSAFLLAAGSFGEWLPWSGKRRETIQGAGRLSPQSAVCSRALGFSGTLVMGFGFVETPLSRAVLLTISLVLSLLYAFLYLRSSFGSRVLQFPLSSPSQKVETASMDEDQRMDLLFKRIETYMQRERPYLDDSFTLSALAKEMLTNKGMLSKTINTKSKRNFCQYVNSYRIQYAVSLMKKDHRIRVVELSLMSGFHSVASFNMAFKLFMNDTPSEYMRTLQAMELLHPGGLEGEKE